MASIGNWGMFPLDRFPPDWEVRWDYRRVGWIVTWTPRHWERGAA